MPNDPEVRDFLTSRRGRLTPERAGIIGGGRRRVPGLRREEVAMLARVSTDYYVRMERGNLSGVSQEILDAVAAALRLSDVETEHLHDLARATASESAVRSPQSPAIATLRPSLQRMLDAVTGAAAYVSNPRQDLIATNPLARALFSPVLDDPAVHGNIARFIFLSTASRPFYPDWNDAARNTVAAIRFAAAQNPHDKPLTNLIGELVTRSDDFRHRWAAHEVRSHTAGNKRIVHPDVGDLDVVYERVDLPGTESWQIFIYTVEPNSPSEERLRLLGSLAATLR